MPVELYLSRVEASAEAIANPYEIHRLLWAFFPGMPDASRPYLYRLRPGTRRAAREILMLSTVRPTGRDGGRAVLADCRRFSPCFYAGQTLRFEITANPVKRLAGSRDRVPLIRDEERLAWLGRQLEGAAEIQGARITASEKLYFQKPGTGAGKVDQVIFSGELRVVDAERLLGKCRNGVGPAKSLGCGLLLLSAR